MISLDDNGARNFAITTSLKLGSDIDKTRTDLGGRVGLCGAQPHQRRASRSEVLVERMGFTAIQDLASIDPELNARVTPNVTSVDCNAD